MSKVKFAKRVEFLVTETISIIGRNIAQTYKFWTPNKKYLKYAYDHRFCLKRKLEHLYEKDLLDYKFISKDEYEDKVVFNYEDFDGSNYNFPAKTINCEFYLPPFNGCLYCTKCEKKGDFLYCKEKKKHYDSTGIKSCPIFQSVDELIS